MRNTTSNWLIAAAIIFVVFQLWWFGSKSLGNIDYDGMAYIGIARHLRQGESYSAINAFRSPLLSWIIAAFPGRHFLRAGKVVNIASYLFCGLLLYLFAWRLWKSKAAAALSVLLFVFGRGLVSMAVATVVPDFLFATITLVYFLVLLECVRAGKPRHWFYLGAIHGLAYLAKAFALPWLAVCTLIAVFLSSATAKQRIMRLTFALCAPVIVAGVWAGVLHSKYGVYTTGTQFKTNLMQWTLSAFRGQRYTTYALLRDTTKEVDEYVVDDPMPPGSWAWTYRVSLARALPKVILAEARNVPRVLKEILIVVTPGGVIAFVAVVAIVGRSKIRYPVEWIVIAVITGGAISLVGAYSMLVFDTRYLFPLIPLLLAVACRFLISDEEWNHGGWRTVAIVMVVIGVIASITYSSSPFRLLTRDFQMGCYDAGNQLKAHSGTSVVSIGSGRYPEHGVGWEVGYKAAYFGNRRLIAVLDEVPSQPTISVVMADIAKASPDAVIVWDDGIDARALSFVNSLLLRYPDAASEKISDPALGSVGTVVFLKHG